LVVVFLLHISLLASFSSSQSSKKQSRKIVSLFSRLRAFEGDR